MSKLHRLVHEIKTLERAGLVKVEGDEMTIIKSREIVVDRILQTGPWGALLLMGVLPDALKEIKGVENDG